MQRKVYPNEWLGLSLTKLELGIAPRRKFEEFASPCACLPRVTKSDKSAGSDMRSGSLPKHKHRTLSFDGALPSPTPEEQKARGRVEAQKRRHKKDPEEGKGGKKEPFINRPTFDAIGRELISLVAATLREIGKHDVESPTKAGETMLLPLAQKMSKILNRCASKQVRIELVEGLGNTYGFDMAREESMEGCPIRDVYHMTLFFYNRPFQAQLGVMGFLETHE